MNGRKFFFFDIDGTLTTPLTNDYPDSTREAIKELKDNGHFVAIATGRMQADAWEVAKALGICAAVSDGGNEGLPLEDCIRTLSEIDSERFPFAVCPENKKMRVATSDLYLSRVKDRYYETVVDPSFDFRKVDTIHKIFVACTKDDLPEIPLHTLPHVWFRKDNMLIEPVHKERGIFEVMKRYNLSDEDVVVFGDGMNDRSMFRDEWFSIAMGNAKPQLKEKAKYITKRADDDGIYYACKKFGWI